ncbi:MAG: dynamin family protein [Lachnospiraceae bacterium]|jgi:GTPase SAR1 family protein/gas vesicle protein|nr:dynamin family protein [Lachnospiraceae bacterium]MBQ5474455.1 dynamin family protein [Lachnospiraceae bacterium]
MDLASVYKEKFKKLKDIQDKYQIDSTDTQKILESIDTYRVNTPVVGNFSTGKSSMINAIINKPLLSVDITPETAVPTEIYYGNNKVYQYDQGRKIERRIDELPLKGLTIQTTSLVQVEYDNEFLKEIKSVNIVDLPGFDTSFELHNRAIDQYLPNSLAYLLVVSSDEPVLKESIAEFIKELKAYNMPVYVVITKCNRLDEDELEECKEELRKAVGKIVERDDVGVACVDSYGNVKVDELKDILRIIQSQTSTIFVNKYSKMLRNASRYTEVYLEERIDKANLSTSRLEQEQEKVEKKMAEITFEIDKEKSNFSKQAKVCINTIRDRIKGDLEATLPTVSAMLENGSDITDKINSVVRRSVRVGINTEFEPKLKKYVEHISEMITIELPENDMIINNVNAELSDNIAEEVTKTALPVIMAGVGFLLGPIGAVIGGMAGIVADIMHNKSSNKKKQKEVDKAARQIIDEVTKQTIVSIEGEIRKYIENINKNIERDVLRQRAILEKSLSDIKVDISIEESSRSRDIEDLEKDLKVIKEYRIDNLRQED